MKAGESNSGAYPTIRPRRLRYHPLVRQLVRETTLSASHFILPLFIRFGRGMTKDIPSMPGHAQHSVDRLIDIIGPALELGVKSFIFFGIPENKDAVGSPAWDENGIVCRALRQARNSFGDKVLLITDECFCEYTDHG